MTGQRNATEVTEIETVLRDQWLRLRQWVEQVDDAAAALPSVLGDWTVEDLIAHLGRAMGALADAQPAPDGTVPLTLSEYVGTYPGRAKEISESTHELAAQISDAPLAAVDRIADQAFATTTVLRSLAADPVVQARRGPIRLSEMLLSRLIELVVHGDDLARSVRLPGAGPLDDAAVRLVAETLLEVAVDRGGWDLEVIDPIVWIRLACGRVPYDVDVLASALQARHTSDSVPDLGRVLPLL